MADLNNEQFWEHNLNEIKTRDKNNTVDFRNDPSRDIQDWSKSSFFGQYPFPTSALRSIDPTLAEPQRYWSTNPDVRRRQSMPKPMKTLHPYGPNRPESAPQGSYDVDPGSYEQLQEQLREAGAPEQVTVYHFGKAPRDAEYLSGSVSPDWPEAVRSGWRSKDPSINRGRLRIHIIPREDILAHGGTENEVFWRRPPELNKTKRTQKQQSNAEDSLESKLFGA